MMMMMMMMLFGQRKIKNNHSNLHYLWKAWNMIPQEFITKLFESIRSGQIW